MLCSRSPLSVWLRWAPSSPLPRGSSCPARRLCPLLEFSWGEAPQGQALEAHKHSWPESGCLGAQLPHPASFRSALTCSGFSCSAAGLQEGAARKPPPAAQGLGLSTPNWYLLELGSPEIGIYQNWCFPKLELAETIWNLLTIQQQSYFLCSYRKPVLKPPGCWRKGNTEDGNSVPDIFTSLREVTPSQVTTASPARLQHLQHSWDPPAPSAALSLLPCSGCSPLSARFTLPQPGDSPEPPALPPLPWALLAAQPGPE